MGPNRADDVRDGIVGSQGSVGEGKQALTLFVVKGDALDGDSSATI